MITYLPYIVSVICAAIAGLTSYTVARKQTKADLNKLEKQHELDIEKEREKFAMEKERMEIEHKYEMELKQKELENALGSNVTSAIVSEAMKLPEVKQMMSQGISKNKRYNHR